MEDLIRVPAVADSFYPAESSALSTLLDGLLSKAKPRYSWDNKKPKIVISPHAGIYFSGSVAAYAYKNLLNTEIKTIILLGVSHNYFFDYAAVFPKGEWITPLGKVEVDEEVVRRIIDEKRIIPNVEFHLPEHTLEMQLIFLQKVLKNGFKIVPILLSQVGKELHKEVVESLSQELKDDDKLLVISTDLSHYPPYRVANNVDILTIRKILDGDVLEFADWIRGEALGIDGVETLACGRDAVSIGLDVAKKLRLEDVRYYKYASSGDISGEKQRVVGYVSLGFYGGKQDYKIETLQLARQSLEFYLRTKKKVIRRCESDRLMLQGGAFVTLNEDNQLRGCIGEIIGRSSYCTSIQENAVNAAVSDSRFYPLSLGEINDIEIEVSLLSPLKKIDDWKKIKLGRDGVVVRRGLRSGVFLPQVGNDIPDLKRFLEVLCLEKAGLEKDCYKNSSTDIYVFTADVFKE